LNGLYLVDRYRGHFEYFYNNGRRKKFLPPKTCYEDTLAVGVPPRERPRRVQREKRQSSVLTYPVWQRDQWRAHHFVQGEVKNRDTLDENGQLLRTESVDM